MGGGNPIKKITKQVKRSVKQVGKQVERSAGDVTDTGWWTKSGTALMSAASDPGTWLAYAVNPTVGLGMGAQQAKENYAAMSQAERDEADAEAARNRAKMEEAKKIETQKKAEAEQAKMVRERDAKAKAESEERVKRLGTGRRGLLYQGAKGKETGTSNVLGG